MTDPALPLQTPLFDLHRERGAKIVPFAGYAMPVNYPLGILKEHQHTRHKTGLFDVSHMGQISLKGNHVASHLETLIPVDLQALPPGRQKYGFLLNERGGILDDLMIINRGDRFILVVNAACKHSDFDHLNRQLGEALSIEMLDDRALLALQGPTAGAVLRRLGQDLDSMKFMDVRELVFDDIACLASRSGYTGEDGFEISVDNGEAETLARRLLADQDVELIGLGARDSLRLEAGLCLYGHDITDDITPVEANLNWAISPSRRINGARQAGFPGADIILPQMPRNVTRRRVGLIPKGRAPVREGVELTTGDGHRVGIVTSGGFSPSLGHPISIGYVDIDYTTPDTELLAVVRNKSLPVKITRLPFVAHRYYR